MIYLTQLIFIEAGQEDAFNQFEAISLPLISKYKGRLMLRIRPSAENFIEYGIDKPYEIHLVEFESEQAFENFKNDKERQRYLYLKEQSIRSTLLIQGMGI